MTYERTALLELQLKNYRRFENMDLSFEPDLTVLVAESGGGKTALLDAVAIAIALLVDELRKGSNQGFAGSDVRQAPGDTGAMVAMTPTSLRCVATLGGERIEWARQLASVTGRSTSTGTRELKSAAQRLLAALQAYAVGNGEAPLFPLIACYRSGRSWSSTPTRPGKNKTAEDRGLQTYAYLDALAPSSGYAQFVVWFESVVREAQAELQSNAPSPHAPRASLEAVRRAVDVVLGPSRWSRLDWDFLQGELVANHPEHGRLPVAVLSEGIRNLIGMVGDLARRAVRLNPHLRARACEESPGIVLIDEIDMRLHPSWQRSIISLLRATFPRVQFVVTTHSPLVLSTVAQRSIRFLGADGTIAGPEAQSLSHSPPRTAILDILGVP